MRHPLAHIDSSHSLPMALFTPEAWATLGAWLAVIAFIGGGSVLMLALFWLIDRLISWFSLSVWGVTLGFPEQYRITSREALRGLLRRRHLGVVKVGSLGMTDKLYYSATEQGLAVGVRTNLRNDMMPPMLIPWDRLRIEKRARNRYCVEVWIHVLDDAGEVRTSIERISWEYWCVNLKRDGFDPNSLSYVEIKVP